jgi:hypothetical protein
MKVIRNVRQISRLGTVSAQRPPSFQLALLNQAHLQQNYFRPFSADNQKPKNFFTTFVDTLKDEMQKNKDLQVCFYRALYILYPSLFRNIKRF